MTTYAGHSGAGGFFDLDAKISHLTTSETMGAESIIMILSCSSMKTYFRDIIRLFPYVHFIGTDEPTYTDRNAVVFLETIRGIVAGRPWEGIKMKVMEKMGYKPEHPFIYRFPNDEENKEK